MLDELISKKITEFINNNGRAGNDLVDLSNKLMDLSTEAKFDFCPKSFIQNTLKTGMKALESSYDKEQFEKVLMDLRNNVR